jgi:hypothetical protein
LRFAAIIAAVPSDVVYGGETGAARCTAWASAGSVPLTPDRELAIPEDAPAAASLKPVREIDGGPARAGSRRMLIMLPTPHEAEVTTSWSDGDVLRVSRARDQEPALERDLIAVRPEHLAQLRRGVVVRVVRRVGKSELRASPLLTDTLDSAMMREECR